LKLIYTVSEQAGLAWSPSITEENNTAMNMLGSGFATMFLNERLVFGMAPEDLQSALTQRLRWAMGALQVWICPISLCCVMFVIPWTPRIQAAMKALASGLCYRVLGSGFATMFLNERLVFGMAPEDLQSALTQRLRWAMGALQVGTCLLGL
jgi:cellulose synthase/poly-beta-1,6-N-acetylglucosamine synthase-like glycosyltransferase